MKGQRQSREKMEILVKELQAQLGNKHQCKIIPAGSFRRHKRGIGDLDLIAIEPNPPFIKASIDIDGIQVDIRSCNASYIGAMLLYFTGSKWHNIKLRQRAENKNWKLTEYGLFDKNNVLIHSQTEKQIYNLLDINWIHPRERSMDKFSKISYFRCGAKCSHCKQSCCFQVDHLGQHETDPIFPNIHGHSFHR